jgi:hypothetical protein
MATPTPQQIDSLLQIGIQHFVPIDKIQAILDTAGSAMKKMRDDAYRRGQLVMATNGEKARSMILLETNYLILSARSAEELQAEWNKKKSKA